VVDAGNQRVVRFDENGLKHWFPIGVRDISSLYLTGDYGWLCDRTAEELVRFHRGGVLVDVVKLPGEGVVVDRGGRYLLGRRPAEKRHGGLWEFPGGKMLEGEGLLDAAHRELQEELALRATGAGATLFSVSDSGSPFVINFVEITVDGEPDPSEHSQIGWFELTQLREMALAPSDAAFVDWLARQR